MLEEVGLDYTVYPIDITAGDQHGTEFLQISPNAKIPAIVDHETGLKLMESGAILLYLAEKAGSLLPTQAHARWRAIEWLMWQMGGLGPILGQVHHFVKFNKGKSEYSEARYLSEGRRLYGVLDRRLAEHEYLAGEYSVADIATWPWISRFAWQTINLDEFPQVKRWYVQIAARPAVQRGYHIPRKVQEIPMP